MSTDEYTKDPPSADEIQLKLSSYFPEWFCLKNTPEYAPKVQTKPPQIVRQKTGRPSVHADRRARNRAYYLRKKQQKQEILSTPLPAGPYRVIYADPPWDYGRAGYQKYGYASCHYPVLSIPELCKIPVKQLAAKHAVLFLWVTAPMLEKAFAVIKAWGFAYKTQVIWDKESHNFGHYFSVRHEHLLLCTRGRCRPDVHELEDSVRVIKRSQHSEKPEEFRMLIDKLYPTGPRIELFARSTHEGWDSWGNEVSLGKEVPNERA